ncbi:MULTISPECIES: hypothetical protein [unclassified Mycolicibacterium]|uniref:hypothetical protein n=1 Tax=unclassified Mycolicibacterium TaxID=2636767 RepID=UPI0012DF94BC|nr:MULTISPECIES: hypothetical protein [unclassified Mycolicibacterium]MUL83469.1 hypothetical protein [Mycolicibacterium sp. CBMA 329]MUL90460.1 hypothetical protein [Mycolicibacterium sp. CBMA 331]MUM00432.1 hypothetical protein [Mycolicibacterium sp. CBMA 334]MUM28727.1 hypothetical protein [Mycolicibacterium sp. CBMA 295]MUM41404.1 hypothetical protein [Mycolicibacterium sp. CBMA 247]
MLRASNCAKVFASFGVLCAGIFLAPAAGADPTAGARSAADTINDLTAKGYNVQINWVSGVSSERLSRCRVTAVHNPDRSPGIDPSNTTVYVDVSCPNEPDDGVWGGIGIGFG